MLATAPGAKLSATIAAFSAALQRRRRGAPVRTSTRRKLCPSIGKLFGKSASLPRPNKAGSSVRPQLPQYGSSVSLTLLVHTSPTKRSTDFVALLDQLGATYGTAERARPLVAVLDNGPIHCSKLTTRALAERTWLTLEWLPKYAPELNDIERCWRDLKQHQLANRTFTDPDAVARAIPDAVARLNYERQPKQSPIPMRSA